MLAMAAISASCKAAFRNREPQSRSMCPRKEGIIAVGEIVDMMLDGTLCECCGAFIDDDDDASGFPRYCSDQMCERPRRIT